MLKHFIVWYSETKGMQVKWRTSHSAMESLVNKVIHESGYVKGTCKVLVGVEELKPDSGKGLM